MQKFGLLFLFAAFHTRAGILLDEPFNGPLGGLPPNWATAVAAGSGLPFESALGIVAGLARSGGEVQLYSPLLTITGLPLTVTLIQEHNGGGRLNSGTVLEYSLNGNAYQDVLSTESRFLSGAYTHEVQSPNPLIRGGGAFRKVWDSGLKFPVILITPAGPGTIQFRFAAGDSLRATLLHFTVEEGFPPENVPEPATFAYVALATLFALAGRRFQPASRGSSTGRPQAK